MSEDTKPEAGEQINLKVVDQVPSSSMFHSSASSLHVNSLVFARISFSSFPTCLAHKLE